MATEFSLQERYHSTILDRIAQMQKGEDLKLPADYDVSEALQSAMIALRSVPGKNYTTINAFDSRQADQTSVYNALLSMATQGLSVGKNQGYLIAYGNKITFMRSYFGTQTVLKRLPEIKDVFATVVHQDDKFVVDIDESGNTIVKDHHTDFQNLDKPLVGAYATIVRSDGSKLQEVMTMEQIKNSWSQAKTSKVQEKFPDQMAKRTVINRLAKNIINSVGGNELLVSAINRSTEDEFDNRKDVTVEKKQAENIFEEVVDDDQSKKIETDDKSEPEQTELIEDQPDSQSVPVHSEPEKPDEEPSEIDKYIAEGKRLSEANNQKLDEIENAG